MANKRMFSKKIVDTDAFLDMPLSTQALYFHLSMRADDDGFVASPKKIMRMLGVNDDELKVLFTKKFILGFESGVIVIKHWRMHNTLKNDRYSPTTYTEEFAKLSVKNNGSYTLEPEWNQNGSKLETQYSIDKYSIDKSKFKKPSIGDIYMYCLKTNKPVDIEKFYDYYEKVGWKTNKGEMKSWAGATTQFKEKDQNVVYRAVLRLINDYFGIPRVEWKDSDKRVHTETGVDFLKVYTETEQFINQPDGLPANKDLLDLIHRQDFIQYLEKNAYEQND